MDSSASLRRVGQEPPADGRRRRDRHHVQEHVFERCGTVAHPYMTAPDLVRFAHGLSDGTLLDPPWADVFTAAKVPHGPTSFGAYQVPVSIVDGQWVYSRAGGDHWNIYPDTGWVGVILGNYDDFPLTDMIERETRAVTGQS